MKNLIIIGSGPAGLTCAIYAARSGLNPVLIAGDTPGGQLIHTDLIENFPGFESISGADLMVKMLSHAESVGTEIIYETVNSLSKNIDGTFEVKLSSNDSIATKSIVIATGAKHKHLAVSGEKEFTNRGVSWCATCDGPMFKEKKVAVIGGGNTAVMEALFLSNFATNVFLIHRRDSLRADKIMQEKLLSNPKIKCIWDSSVVKISGEKTVKEITIKNLLKETESPMTVDGVFIAIGTSPSSEFAKGLVEFDDQGYIKANNTSTSTPGVFAIGDVVSGSLKQAIYSAGQGALAAKCVEEYLGVR